MHAYVFDKLTEDEFVAAPKSEDGLDLDILDAPPKRGDFFRQGYKPPKLVPTFRALPSWLKTLRVTTEERLPADELLAAVSCMPDLYKLEVHGFNVEFSRWRAVLQNSRVRDVAFVACTGLGIEDLAHLRLEFLALIRCEVDDAKADRFVRPRRVRKLVIVSDRIKQRVAEGWCLVTS